MINKIFSTVMVTLILLLVPTSSFAKIDWSKITYAEKVCKKEMFSNDKVFCTRRIKKGTFRTFIHIFHKFDVDFEVFKANNNIHKSVKIGL